MRTKVFTVALCAVLIPAFCPSGGSEIARAQGTQGTQGTLKLTNQSKVPIRMFWFNRLNREVDLGVADAGAEANIATTPNDRFIFRNANTGQEVRRFQVVNQNEALVITDNAPVNAGGPAQFSLSNKTTSPVRLLWINERGQEVEMGVLEAGLNKASQTQTTVGHQFIVRDANSGQELRRFTVSKQVEEFEVAANIPAPPNAGGVAQITVINNSFSPVRVLAVNAQGQESEVGVIPANNRNGGPTTIGQVFVVRDPATRQELKRITVGKAAEEIVISSNTPPPPPSNTNLSPQISAHINVSNKNSAAVRVFSVSANGQEAEVGVVQPNSTIGGPTAIGQVFVMRDANTRQELKRVTVSKQSEEVEVSAPTPPANVVTTQFTLINNSTAPIQAVFLNDQGQETPIGVVPANNRSTAGPANLGVIVVIRDGAGQELNRTAITKQNQEVVFGNANPQPPAANTTYWLGRRAGPGDDRLIYDVQLPDFFVNWMKIQTPIGGGQKFTRTINGQTFTFYKQDFRWDNGGSNPSATGQIAIATDSTGVGLNWQIAREFTGQQYARLRQELTNLATGAQWVDLRPVTMLEATGNAPPNLAVSMQSPFDTASASSEQLRSHAAQPQMVAIPSGNSVVVAWLQYVQGKPKAVKVTNFARAGAGFTRSWEKDLPLNLLAGMTTDGSNFYVLSAKSEDLGRELSSVSYRPNVLIMTKLDGQGNQVWQRDVNNAEFLGDPTKDQNGQLQFDKAIFSPMTAGTSMLAYGNGKIAVALTTNGLPDLGISARHQGSRYFVMGDDGAGFKAADSTSWRHSFNQRLIFDGQDFVFMDVADAGWYMPGAGISLRKIKPTARGADFVGGPEGVYVYARQAETAGSQNFSFTSLGDIETGSRGYSVLFSSEKSNNIAQRDGFSQPVAEPRNLGLVHVVKNFDTVKDGRSISQNNTEAILGNMTIDWTKDFSTNGGPVNINITNNVVDSPGASATFARPGNPAKTFTQTGIVWLTDCKPGVSVERPKLIKVADDRYIAIWEEWTYGGTNLNYQSTKAMLISEYGQVIRPATTINARLNPSGADRPFVTNGQAAWLTGDAGSGKFTLFTIDQNLTLGATDIGL